MLQAFNLWQIMQYLVHMFFASSKVVFSLKVRKKSKQYANILYMYINSFNSFSGILHERISSEVNTKFVV